MLACRRASVLARLQLRSSCLLCSESNSKFETVPGVSVQDHIANSKHIRHEMMQMKRWQEELDRMKIANCCGIFHVDSKIMKNKLAADQDQVLADMKQILQDAARISCDKVLADFELKKGRLSRNPVTLKDFCHFLEDKAEILRETRELLAGKAAVDDIYKLLQSHFGVKIHINAQATWEDLQKSALSFSEFAENADLTVSSRMLQMTQTVKSQVPPQHSKPQTPNP
jgi:hypothetical protein